MHDCPAHVLRCLAPSSSLFKVLPLLRQPFSQIMQCGSTLALRAANGYALQSATKAALKAFTDGVRVSTRAVVERVLCVCC